MDLGLNKLAGASSAAGIARDLARMERERTAWRESLATSALAKQAAELAMGDRDWTRRMAQIAGVHSAAVAAERQYSDLLGSHSAAAIAIKAMQDAERSSAEHMRRMLEPLADIRARYSADSATRRLLKDLADADTLRKQIADLATGVSSARSAAAMLVGQNSAIEEARKLVEGSRIPAYLREFERINRHWQVPSALLDVTGAFKGIQGQLGKVTLPIIDLASARALSEMLGREGVDAQLALLGIGQDGSLQAPAANPEKGLLSRGQSDAVALLSFLLSLLITLVIFAYQETSSRKDKAKAEAAQKAQAQQIQHLTELIEKALLEAAEAPDERFVVRGRIATVRAKPQHGAPVEGKLLPNEVVRAIARRGKWVHVEYYHWVAEEYRTGWVLKHYLERVPANHAARPKQRPAAPH